MFGLALVSMRKESGLGQPLRGIIWFTVAIAASCAVICRDHEELPKSILGLHLSPSHSEKEIPVEDEPDDR